MHEAKAAARAAEILGRVRETRPLVHNITNWVVTNIAANITLAFGASPVMAHAREEAREMVRHAGALVLNIGTLTPALVEAMLEAGRAANERGVPVILDPVGAGATPLRTESALRILEEVKVDILRGNAGEVGILAGAGGKVQGVDAVGGPADGAALARTAAQRFGLVAAVTGKTDYVSDGTRVIAVHNGHPLLTAVTGTGCMASSVVGAFRAVEGDAVWAAASALGCYGYAAELAAGRSQGPGSFQAALFDESYGLTPEKAAAGVRMEMS